MSTCNPKSFYSYLPLHIAAHCYDHNAIRNGLIIEKLSPNATDILQQTPLHVLLKDSHLNSEDMETCLKILINNGADVNACDKNKKTPLYYAITHAFPECTKMLIKAGANLTHSSAIFESNYTLANQLALTMPEVLLDVFDESVTLENHADEPKIRLDLRPILQYVEKHEEGKKYKTYFEPGVNQSEVSFLYSLSNGNHNNLKQLFTHPLLSTFLHLKYRLVGRMWILQVLLVLFPLCYMTLIYHLYFNLCEFKIIIKNSTKNREFDSKAEDPLLEYKNVENKCEITWRFSVCCYILATVVFAWLGSKVYLSLRMGVNYLKSWRIWVNALALVCMAITLWPGLQFETLYDITFQYPIAALGIFFGFVIFLLSVGSHPEISVYLEVLEKILLSVLKIVLLFCPLFIGFYMGFRLMFQNRENVFRFIIMTVDVSSAKYEEMIQDMKDDYFWFSAMGYAFCVAFIIIIVIVFMNFVLGTSISDIQKRKHEAKISIIALKIQHAFIFDLMVGRFTRINFNVKKLKQLKNGEYFYEFSPNDSKCPIPKNIQTQLIKLIKKRKLCEADDNIGKIKTDENGESMGLSARLIDYDYKCDMLLKKIVNLEGKLNGMISNMDSFDKDYLKPYIK